MKYYAVKIGRTPGIYATWPDCQRQVSGFSGAKFKSFSTRAEAESFVKGEESNESNEIEETRETNESNVVYFDGGCRQGCSGGACYIPSTKQVFYQRALPDPETKKETNNRGELTGLILALTHTQGDVVVYGDSKYAMGVGSGRWRNKNNDDLIEQARNLSKNRRITYRHVYGHTGKYGNEICDTYATKALHLDTYDVMSEIVN